MLIQNDKPVIGVSSKHNSFVEPSIRDTYEVKTDYIDSIINAGGIPLIIPCITDLQLLENYMDQVDAMLFIGGDDWPSDFYNEENAPENKSHKRIKPETELYLMQKALGKNIPILGICAGAQLFNIARGGKLIQHIDNASLHSNYQEMHKINLGIAEDSLLQKILACNEVLVNTEHHQAVDPDKLGKDLKITAQAEDGTVEAIECTGNIFRLGVQFHAERPNCKDVNKKIFKAFIAAAENNNLK